MPPVIPIKTFSAKKTCTFAGWREMWREMQYMAEENVDIPRLIEKTKNCLRYGGWWILLDA
jgi:hypothetical protein